MKMITHTQVQELVKKLPETKLPLAYELLQELANNEIEALTRTEFMHLSISERRGILARQAEELKRHYEQSESERATWQAGSFVDEYSTR